MQLQSQQDFTAKLVANYIAQARKLTGTCLEGSLLLRLNAQADRAPFNARRQHASPSTSQASFDDHLVKLQGQNGRKPTAKQATIERKTQIIRQAN